MIFAEHDLGADDHPVLVEKPAIDPDRDRVGDAKDYVND